MFSILVGLLAGLLGAAWAPAVLQASAFALLAALPRRWTVLLFLLGSLVGLLRFEHVLDDYRSLVERAIGEHRIEGRVLAFPEQRADGYRLTVAVAVGPLAGTRLRLLWPAPAPTVGAGDQIDVLARLRSPRGLANPGGFDAEAWAFAAPLHGSGYVQDGRVVGPADGLAARLDRLRARLAGDLLDHAGAAGRDRPRPEAGADEIRPSGGGPSQLLPALAVADRRGLGPGDRATLQATGTMHLLAISGLHVGLVALGAGALGGCLWPLLGRRGSRRGWMLAIGLCAATAYAALAGFALSTVRALAMLLGLAVSWWSRGRIGWASGLLGAAAATLLVLPAASAATAFWLSFGAVACLFLAGAGWLGLGRVARVGRAQAAVFLGLRPVTGALGMGAGLLSPLCNLVAIPWVGWLVVPALLLGVLSLLVGLPQAAVPISVADLALDCLLGLLAAAADLSPAPLPPPPAGVPGMLLAAGALLLLGPPGLGFRALATVLLLCSLLPPRPTPEDAVDVHVLDVGQGLAVVVESGGQRLLYDAGPRSRSGWSAGEGVILPFLARRGGPVRFDRVILSHGDLDHAGGWPAVRSRADRVGKVWSSEPELGAPCRSGQGWRWGLARFRLLHPDPGLPVLGNDSSCVLLIEAHGARLLLPGDVSTAVEGRLAERIEGSLALLLAAHHGSAGSSSPPFIAATAPRSVVFSHGYGNRFHMPRPDVIDRFLGATPLSTAACGHLHLRLDRHGLRLLAAERLRRRRPWHPRDQDDGVQNQYDCQPRELAAPLAAPG